MLQFPAADPDHGVPAVGVRAGVPRGEPRRPLPRLRERAGGGRDDLPRLRLVPDDHRLHRRLRRLLPRHRPRQDLHRVLPRK